MTVENFKKISLKITAAADYVNDLIMSTVTLKGWKKVNTWRIKGPFVAVALLLAFF